MDKSKIIGARGELTIISILAMLVLCSTALYTAWAQAELGLSCAPALLTVQPGGTETMMVTVDTPPAADLTVNLASNNPSVVDVPASVTIAAGETSSPVTVTGVAQGTTYITASTEVEQASCSAYVAPRFSGDARRLPGQAIRVIVGPLPAEPTTAFPLRILVLPVPFGITQPVKVVVQAP